MSKKFFFGKNHFSDPLTYRNISIYQICEDTLSHGVFHPDHLQICHEITYVVSGKGISLRNGESFSVEPGNLFINKLGDLHSIRAADRNSLRYFCLGFTINTSDNDYNNFYGIEKFFENPSNPISKSIYDISEQFTGIINELNCHAVLSDDLIYSHLVQILIYTYRSFQTDKADFYYNPNPIDESQTFIYNIIRYIDSNTENITRLSDLKNHFGYSYEYISKTFSKAIGMPIKQYYDQRRFEKAIKLLFSSVSISEISNRLGYTNVQSFCKAFKKRYHMPPREYKKMISTTFDYEE